MGETELQTFADLSDYCRKNLAAAQVSPTRVDIPVGRSMVSLVSADSELRPETDLVLFVGSTEAIEQAGAKLQAWEAMPLVVPTFPSVARSTIDTLVAISRKSAHVTEQRTLSELISIGRSLSRVRDVNELLERILRTSRELTRADSGTLYVVEYDGDEPVKLWFRSTQNDSVEGWGHDGSIPVSSESIVGHSVLSKRSVNISDLYKLGEPDANPWGFVHNRELDILNGYETHSLLTVPLISARKQVIGVIQLINCRTGDNTDSVMDVDYEDVIPFSAEAEEITNALAGQAGIVLENALLYDEVKSLFEGFVRASVTAIESRDPTTSGHSERVALLTVGLAREVDRVSSGRLQRFRFSPDELQEIEYASLLHDFGKVGVREAVLVKAKKLYPFERDLIEMRFGRIEEQVVRQALQEGVPPEQIKEKLRNLKDYWQDIITANEPSVLDQEVSAHLAKIGEETYWVGDCALPYLTDSELASLQVARGSLTPEERKEIESHVTHSYNFLKEIPWTANLSRVPEIAWAHHEKLDGTGYPCGKGSEQIPIGSKMMAVADIFDALTASDRPYKKAVPLDKALMILRSEAERGKIDGELVELFAHAEVFTEVTGHESH